MFAGADHGNSRLIYLPIKINKPSLLQKIIPRSQLLLRFDEGIHGALTTVVSPAGYGKTTSVLAWTETHDEMPVAWFLLDEEDRALDRFWLYFTASMRIADKAICHELDHIRLPDNFPSMIPILDSILLQLAQYGDNFIFVLEDFHTVHDSASICESLLYFIKHLPPNAHIVITSRQSLRLPLSKTRADGLLNEITEADLSFSAKELKEYFYLLGLAFSQEQCQSIYESTQGWPTGSKLIALRFGRDTEQEIDEVILRAKNSINDYLFEEVFSSLPENMQHFLLATSIVSSFTLSLAENITGLKQGATVEMIDALVANDLFIEKIERKGGKDWYRYHLLFVEMLHQRLERMDREKINKMRLVARDWFNEQGYLDYVVEMSAELKDFDNIKQVLTDNWKRLYMSDSHFVLLRWAKEIPFGEILQRPLLCAILTMPYAIKGELEKARSLIEQALSRLHDKEDFLYAFCMVQKTYLYHFANDTESMNPYLEEALKYLPKSEFYLRGMMAQIQAATWMETDPLRSKKAFLREIDTQIPLGSKGLSCSLYCCLAWVCANLGHFEESEHYIDLAFSLFDEHEYKFKPMLSYAYLSQMTTCYQQKKPKEALKAFEDFQGSSFEGAVPASIAEALAVYAKTKFIMRDAESKDIFFKAISMNESGALLCLPSLGMTKMYFEAFRTTSKERINFLSDKKCVRFFDLSIAYYVSPQDYYQKVCDFAEGIDTEEHILKLSALTLCIAYSEKCGHAKQAEKYLKTALDFAQKTKLRQPLLENLGEIELVIRRIRDQALETSSIALISEMLEYKESHGAIVELSQREIDVMRMIALGYTIQGTAKALYVSRDTVKKHLGNIYAKLGVHSKLDAVTALRDKGVL